MKTFFRYFFSFVGLGLLWLLHWLPLPVLRFIGRRLGQLFYHLGRERREVALTNLSLCFPELESAERVRLAKQSFANFACALLDRTLLWWASRERLEKILHMHGTEHLAGNSEDEAKRPVILFGMHFVGLEAGATRLAMARQLSTVYSNQKNPVFNAVLLTGRVRFNGGIAFSRQEGIRKVIRTLKDGVPLYYLPDMDFGPRDAVFVPFFGVQAATITGLSRLAQATNARVLPCISRLTDQGYDFTIFPALENFPGDAVETDTARMNQIIEAQVRQMPEQYFWLHKRFKTRPPGEERIYKK